MLLVLYVRMCFLEYLALRLTNRGGQRQRNNQQGKYHAECHVEATKQRGNQRPANTADTEAEINDAVVFRQVVQAEELAHQ